ncbi:MULTISPECIES: Sec-independent protein translocase protein TatB [Pseudoalteromonas]|uniref:Sec-independent protein translocase protein TatB n=1 Tax=Pseudoalteromonas TaxID=53246 RepID=UPI00029ACCF5|nr:MULTISPECIES: Sec-independent protein translocase protein TatB [Pseudoalteromonas]AUJ71637.1 Sec-independent protein translocase protein TatB [Pseudoalteromonas sp. NC201]MBR8845498.1 Sec-independent protein translocase subunit TatB [Pseudoalteromonas sp. JC3]MCF2828404.1 Sec-independent protein translocase protein TatB [Pseudoalteromonas sp. OF5H-5]MCF2833766.1 Sec-independent protein translocase protein TatB [Pseudoalteromonas sp. DL2-H6]MCF2924492.1 Sec-independent protein translocase pr
MGMWELVVVLIVGLIVLGPERLPVAIRTVARWIKTVKSVANSVKAEVSEELRVHELHNNLKKAEQQGMQDLAPELKQSVQELQEAAESVRHSYKSTENNKNKD